MHCLETCRQARGGVATELPPLQPICVTLPSRQLHEPCTQGEQQHNKRQGIEHGCVGTCSRYRLSEKQRPNCRGDNCERLRRTLNLTQVGTSINTTPEREENHDHKTAGQPHHYCV